MSNGFSAERYYRGYKVKIRREDAFLASEQ